MLALLGKKSVVSGKQAGIVSDFQSTPVVMAGVHSCSPEAHQANRMVSFDTRVLLLVLVEDGLKDLLMELAI